MAVAKKEVHYFLINHLGQGVDRRGAFFLSEEDAIAYADEHLSFATWVIPAVPTAKAKNHRLLDRHGNQIQPEG